MYEVKNDVLIPVHGMKPDGFAGPKKYPFGDMVVGDSFNVPKEQL